MSGERILVVDDDKSAAALLEGALADAGYRVSVEHSTCRLEPAHTVARADLLVLDWTLPGRDGLTFCRELRAQPEGERVKVLMLTARGQRQDQLTALASGADDYLAKPFDIEVLLARVRGLLRARAAERAERARAAVGAVALALAGQTERHHVLDLIVSHARDLVGGTMASLLLREPDSGELRVGARVGFGDTLASAATARVGHGLVGMVLADGEPRITANWSAVEGVPSWVPELGLQGAVSVPLTLGQQVVGSLTVADVTDRSQYDEDDVEILRLLASHGALAIERARLLDTQAQRAQQAEEVRRQMVALAALAEARASQLEAVLEQMADAVVVVDRSGRINRVNRAAERLLGTQRHSLADRQCTLDHDLLDPTTRLAATAGVLEQALRAGQTTVEREFLCRTHDGERLLSVSVAPVLQETNATGAVAVLRDVTERHHLQLQLSHADKLQALGELAMGVAHNFNNVLTAIMSRSELLAREVDHPVVAEAMDYVLRAADDGAAMIRRIQAFARRAGTGVRVPVDAEALLRDAIAVSEPRWRDAAQRRGATVQVHLDLLPTQPVLGDPGELREVLVNLINNAADALPNGGRIMLTCRPQGDQVELLVTDNGVGMPPEIQRHIFEPFYTTKGDEGTGLGLAVSYGIVVNHGGTLRVESKPNEGTTMCIALPIVADREVLDGSETGGAPSAATVDLPAVEAPDPRRVLVVDDDPKLASMLQQILLLDGHEVDVCASGAEALEAVSSCTYALVLTDVGMPGMSGLELSSELTSRYPDLPVGLITGWGNAIDPAEREASGARYMLSKPYRIEQVRQLVQAALIAPSGGSPSLV